MNYGNDSKYPTRRFPPQVPIGGKEYESPYDMSTAELQDLAGRQSQAPYKKITLDLSVARTSPLEINAPGQCLVIYGSDGSAIRTVNTTALVWAQFNQWDPNILDGASATPNAPGGYPMKHARGWRGPFLKTYLTWPAQSGVWVDVIVLASKEIPWIDGEVCT